MTSDKLALLSPDQKRGIIANVQGWVKLFSAAKNEERWYDPTGGNWLLPPDYLGSLDAIASAVNTLPVGLWNIYASNLERICLQRACEQEGRNPWPAFATADLHADAFLLTVLP